MTKAKDDVITHGNYLDRAIIRVASGRVRELVAEGLTPHAALSLATPGTWSEYRSDVQAFMRASDGGG
jgi:hypothetical protein